MFKCLLRSKGLRGSWSGDARRDDQWPEEERKEKEGKEENLTIYDLCVVKMARLRLDVKASCGKS